MWREYESNRRPRYNNTRRNQFRRHQPYFDDSFMDLDSPQRIEPRFESHLDDFFGENFFQDPFFHRPSIPFRQNPFSHRRPAPRPPMSSFNDFFQGFLIPFSSSVSNFRPSPSFSRQFHLDIGQFFGHFTNRQQSLFQLLSQSMGPLFNSLFMDNRNISFEQAMQNLRESPQVRPATREAVSRVRTTRVPTDGNIDEACSICLENFKAGETVKKLRCQHVFHGDCIVNWLNVNNTCPVCRERVDQQQIGIIF